MKPDLEDFEDLNDEVDAPRSRAMSWVVLGLAVVGFASLAYYAYHSGSQASKEGDMLLVAADESPVKTAPANPGGEEFPNKDKTIYDVIAPQNGEKQVEKLLPEPQSPVMPTNADHEDDDVDGVAAAPAPTTAPTPAVAPAPAPAAAPASETTTYVSKKLVPVGEDPAAQQKAPTVATPAPAKAVGEPNFVNEKPAAAKAEKPAVAKPTPKPAAKPAASAGGSYQVQLGAYKSEAEAQAAWKKISGAHAGVLGGAPTIVKADVNGSTFYRLRAGSYASTSDAKAACAKLGGQACFPAK
ncbi:MAG: SPOR domain-containing protein [Rickettsiales bacterium]